MTRDRVVELIRIGYMKIADHLALGVAEQVAPDGQAGIEPVPVRSFRRMEEDLVDRELQGAFLPLPAAFDLYSRGEDIRVVLFLNREGGSLLQKRAAGVSGLEGFRGKTILVSSLLSVECMLLHRFLITAGFTVGRQGRESFDVRLVEISPGLMQEVAEHDSEGDVGGFLMPEPWASLAVERGVGDFVFHTGALWACHPSSALVLDRSVLEKESRAVRAFTAALEKAGDVISRSSENEFAGYTNAFFGRKLDSGSPVTRERNRIFSPSMFPPDTEAIRGIMDYMANRMEMTLYRGEMEDFVQTGWCAQH